MSATGQIDPVQALAAQQAPVQAHQGVMDPVQALAMGQSVATPPATSNVQSGNGWEAGLLGGINGATFNLGNKLLAATDATFPSLHDRFPTSQKPTWMERYNENLPQLQQGAALDQQNHPYASLAGSIAGGIANPVTNALPAAKTLGGALLQGGAIGGAYSAGDAAGNSTNMGDFLKKTGTGVATGAALGAATRGLGNMLKGSTRSPDAQLLADEGVPLTIGQSSGGLGKTLEDATTHIPLLGNAIKARQGDAIQGFNRAVYNRVLEPLGISYDTSAPVGNEGIDSIGKTISDAYEKAYDGATVVKSQPVLDGIDSATNQAANLLPKDKVSQIQANINRLVTSKFDENGILNSGDLQNAKNFFAEQSRAGPTASLEDRAMAQAYGNVVSALKDGVSETDPGRGDMLNAADTAYMRYVRASGAASSNAASGKGGVFTPSQFGAALRGSDNSVRHIDFAKGIAPMQDLAQAGQAVLPSSIPDSGTATRGLMEAAPWIGATAMKSPSIAAGAAGALAGGTALYSNPGQSLARALLYGAPGARKAMAAVPQKLLPGILAGVGASSNTPSKPDKDR